MMKKRMLVAVLAVGAFLGMAQAQGGSKSPASAAAVAPIQRYKCSNPRDPHYGMGNNASHAKHSHDLVYVKGRNARMSLVK